MPFDYCALAIFEKTLDYTTFLKNYRVDEKYATAPISKIFLRAM